MVVLVVVAAVVCWSLGVIVLIVVMVIVFGVMVVVVTVTIISHAVQCISCFVPATCVFCVGDIAGVCVAGMCVIVFVGVFVGVEIGAVNGCRFLGDGITVSALSLASPPDLTLLGAEIFGARIVKFFFAFGFCTPKI